MLRSILAVVAAYAIFGLSAVVFFRLSGHDPHAPAGMPFMVAGTIWGMAFAMLAGSLAARIAASRPMLHAVIVAGVIALGATVSLFAAGIAWSAVSALFLMAPAALLGGWLYARSLTSPRT